MFSRLIKYLALGIWFITIPASASPIKPELTGSMSYYDVLKLWGPPNEKIEEEGKRRDIWVYGEAKVVFDQGKVVVWENAPQGFATLPAPVDTKTKEEEGTQPDVQDEAVEQILKDIIGESAAEAAQANAPNPGIQNPANTLNLGRPIPIPPMQTE